MKLAGSRASIEQDVSWRPLVFVIASLAVLLVTPIIVNWRIFRLRSELDERSHARLLLNDMEAAGAAQALIAAQPRNPSGSVDTVAEHLGRQLIGSADSDERQLDSLLRSATPDTRSDLAGIATVERAWHSARPGSVKFERGVADSSAFRLFDMAEQLDARLASRLAKAQAEVHRLQTLDVIVAIVLAPITLLSVLTVFAAGRRARVLARNLAAEREALAQSVEARAALMRGITHDLKNPLGAAAGYVDLLLEGVYGGPLAAEQANMVRRIRKLLVESTATISSLLQISHDREQSEARVALSTVDVAALLREVVEDYRANADERGIGVDIDLPARATVAVTDVRHVQHILGNLLSNAVKYTPEHGHVWVRMSDDDGSDALRIEVRDDGRGIPAPLRERVFEEFFRAEPSAGPGGHGVGLSISRRLARLLGGDITLDGGPEGGARFVFRLPRHATAAAA